MLPSPLQAIALRLKPKQDLKASLDALAQEHNWQAACVLTCVGSIQACTIRFADQPNGTRIEGKHEIVSLTGTLSCTGGSHLHIALSDGQGNTIGGHLLNGSEIYTTAEIVIGVLSAATFYREPCALSGYDELVIKDRE